MRGAVESNAVCTELDQMVERLRAGEHHVLQALAVEPQEDIVVLTSNPWLPIIRGDLRLFTGGIAIDTGQHGPHLLPLGLPKFGEERGLQRGSPTHFFAPWPVSCRSPVPKTTLPAPL